MKVVNTIAIVRRMSTKYVFVFASSSSSSLSSLLTGINGMSHKFHDKKSLKFSIQVHHCGLLSVKKLMKNNTYRNSREENRNI